MRLASMHRSLVPALRPRICRRRNIQVFSADGPGTGVFHHVISVGYVQQEPLDSAAIHSLGTPAWRGGYL